MRKGSGTKTRMSITIDKELAEHLDSFCKERFMKVSPFVENLIKTGMKNLKSKKE